MNKIVFSQLKISVVNLYRSTKQQLNPFYII